MEGKIELCCSGGGRQNGPRGDRSQLEETSTSSWVPVCATIGNGVRKHWRCGSDHTGLWFSRGYGAHVHLNPSAATNSVAFW